VAGENRRREFLKINPAGRVPVLVDDNLVLTESVAIVLYLAEKYPHKGLVPTDIKQRAQVNRWLLFAATELEQPLWRISRHTALYPEHLRLPAEVSLARQDFTDMVVVMEDHMQGPPVHRWQHCDGRRPRMCLYPRLGQRGPVARRLSAAPRVYRADVCSAE
jgi:glutathione S-transferase